MGTKRHSKQHTFAAIPRADIPRSTFDRSHGVKTALFGGDLVPVFVDEALPGDTMNMNATIFARVATLLEPIMDNIYLDVFWFSCPYRLVWDNWGKFNGEQTDPGDSTDYLIPVIDSGAIGWGIGSLQDYMGVPPLVPDMKCSSLPLRAYNLIWNEWFRSEDLQDSLVKNMDDGPDMISDYALKKRGKRHDYFTSCLPWPQKGDAVELPLGSTAPVVSAGDGFPEFTSGTDTGLKLHMNTTTVVTSPLGTDFPNSFEWESTKLEADLSSATASTINAIRQAFQIQKLYASIQ